MDPAWFFILAMLVAIAAIGLILFLDRLVRLVWTHRAQQQHIAQLLAEIRDLLRDGKT